MSFNGLAPDLQEMTRTIGSEDVGKFCVSVTDAKRLLDMIRDLQDRVTELELTIKSQP